MSATLSTSSMVGPAHSATGVHSEPVFSFFVGSFSSSVARGRLVVEALDLAGHGQHRASRAFGAVDVSRLQPDAVASSIAATFLVLMALSTLA
ncbi:MAG TPA: hypothetical protein VFY73_07280 [Ideonella sp.]|uniref:hypothetical protein n=1 Tax=Ideonella sp. TaxID=1929293 RepID=UPI002E371664|nr:hypothetical protein [Ideonella sp.]HEX5683822.1 hypothetical protein [Ideonella sp.]